VGLFLRRQQGALALAVPGEVRMNTFVRPPLTGSQLVAGGFPVDASLADWKLTSGAGLTAGTSPVNADQVLAWADNAFSVFYLRDGPTPQWRNTATGLVDYTNAPLFSKLGANLLFLRAGSPGAAAGVAPVALVQAVPFKL